MGARTNTTCNMKVNSGVANGTLRVGLLYPPINLVQINIPNPDFAQTSFQSLPMAGVSPQKSVVATQHLVNAVAKQITPIFCRHYCFIEGNNLSVDICKFRHGAIPRSPMKVSS